MEFCLEIPIISIIYFEKLSFLFQPSNAGTWTIEAMQCDNNWRFMERIVIPEESILC